MAVPATPPTIRQPTALPLTAGGKTSAIIVCPATIKYVPVNPVRILKAVKAVKFGDTAVPIDVKNNTTIAAL